MSDDTTARARVGRFYVYHLTDSRTGEIFYIGKGTSGRIYKHVEDALDGKKGKKCERIREIIADGGSVDRKVVARFAVEADAYAEEAKQIAEIGLENLSNEVTGGAGGLSRESLINQRKSMPKGGHRPGSGRPKGAKSAKTKIKEAMIQQALEQGITPLEVMLNTMRELYESGDALGACQIARDAAPYLHPKLANTSLNHEGDVGMNITISTGIARDDT